MVMMAACFFTQRDNAIALKKTGKSDGGNYIMNEKKFCSHCGKELLSQAVVCPHCGCPVTAAREADIPSTGLNVLSFFMPLVGLVLYCLYHDKAPNKAKQIGKWAIISVCILSAIWLVSYVLLLLTI